MKGKCAHLHFIGDRCAECMKNKESCGNPSTVPFNFLRPNLSMSMKAIKIYKHRDLRSLTSNKKLQLVLDLDHTLVHAKALEDLTLEDKHYLIKLASMGDDAVSHLYIINLKGQLMLLKLRPGVHSFLKELSTMFELSIYTMGTRAYAREVEKKLLNGSEGGYSFKRVISREDCTTKGQKGLDVVLSHGRVVLIVDDKEDVWAHACKANLIKIAPYEFFTNQRNIDGSMILKTEVNKEGMDKELARVLDILRVTHTIFYHDDATIGHIDGDYATRDVRRVLEMVLKSSTLMAKDRTPECASKSEDDSKLWNSDGDYASRDHKQVLPRVSTSPSMMSQVIWRQAQLV